MADKDFFSFSCKDSSVQSLSYYLHSPNRELLLHSEICARKNVPQRICRRLATTSTWQPEQIHIHLLLGLSSRGSTLTSRLQLQKKVLQESRERESSLEESARLQSLWQASSPKKDQERWGTKWPRTGTTESSPRRELSRREELLYRWPAGVSTGRRLSLIASHKRYTCREDCAIQRRTFEHEKDDNCPGSKAFRFNISNPITITITILERLSELA